tara:strand:- start:29 stop:181 length:153 start_codon:yes stop_codon:yes gene_type:complete
MKKRWITSQEELLALIDRERAKTPKSQRLEVSVDMQGSKAQVSFKRVNRR